MVTIDREAAPAVGVAGLPALLAALSGRARLGAGLLVLPVAIAAFFRDPDRTPDSVEPGPDVVVSPADGKVMYAGS
ncbi:MAG: phosphatidylserine decarboxylase family protein, partial [Gemmatimonadales bacterium]